MRIPKEFKLFGNTIKVVFNEKYLNIINAYGEADYNKGIITLAKFSSNSKYSKDLIIDTFYHEKVHHILNEMGEHDLNKNEKFVDTFAKLLRQSDETAKY